MASPARVRRPWTAALLVGLIAGLMGLTTVTLTLLPTGAAQAIAADDDCGDDPVTTPRGAVPLCDTPNGRTFELAVDEAAAGDTIEFSGTGYVRDEGGGQSLTLKFNDVDIIASRIEADEDGNVSGSVKLPSQEVFDQYADIYDAERWWIRVLVGSGRADGESDAPSASLHDEFELTSAGNPTDDPSDDPSDSPTSTPKDKPDKTDSELPNTGLGDHPGVLWGGGLAVLALAAVWLERRMRRARHT